MNDDDSASSSLRLGVVSDTHGLVRPALFELFAGVDAILHAGDVGEDDVLTDLRAIAPTHAVRGNVDGPEYPERLELNFAGWRFGIAHGHVFPGKGRTDALLHAFPDADFVLYGHTHQARLERVTRESGKIVTIINPGAAGPKRFNQPVTAGILELFDDGFAWALHDLETGDVISKHSA